MPTERSHPALLYELLVAHDDRHSYMRRIDSLVGPGAYTIPSTFQHPAPNLLLRVVQRENYGREFARQKRTMTATSTGAAELTPFCAPCQLCLVTAADTHRARRDQLRKLLQMDRWCQDENAASPVPSDRDHRTVTDSRASPGDTVRRSPSPSSLPSGRRRWESTDLVADFGKASVDVPSEVGARMQQQICARLRYQHFLMRTSYLERLKKQRQRAASQ